MWVDLYGDGNGNPGLIKAVQKVSKYMDNQESNDARNQAEAKKRWDNITHWLQILTFVVLLVGAILGFLEYRHKALAQSNAPVKTSMQNADVPPDPNAR